MLINITESLVNCLKTFPFIPAFEYTATVFATFAPQIVLDKIHGIYWQKPYTAQAGMA
jgi:hypothetical protein